MTGMHKGLGLAGWVILSLVLGLALMGCGGGDEPTAELASPPAAGAVEVATVSATTTSVPLSYDALSTFESKDPFIPRVVEVAQTAATTQSTTATTTSPGQQSTTTTALNPGTTPTTAAPTTTTLAPPLHSLKVISIETYSGQPVVTFKIDSVTFQSKREGDIVSSDWGQVKVVDIDPDAKEVVFLHGSEIRVLKVGQEYLK